MEAKYKYAGYWPRMWAYNADLLILLLIYYMLSWVIPVDKILYITCFGVTLFYHGLFESIIWQATPGKKLLKIKVVNKIGEDLTLPLALLRFILKILSLALLYSGFIMIGFTKKNQGLHDILIGSLVIYENNSPDVEIV
ncbi:MAG: RDD family protein [Bacteroidetes bacterium]|nr:RDD family protein [Bacteroidota bacterium]MDA1118900.1 RDD family protein [Bacteroidota bacterium]